MGEPRYSPREALCFRFSACDYDPTTGEARLAYAFDDHPELVETIRFPGAPWPQDPARQTAFRRALELLHLVAGVSYYKAGVPGQLRVPDGVLSGGLKSFLDEVYIQGLAEFAYVNKLDLGTTLAFEGEPAAASEAETLELQEQALVAMGGGKDSLVALDLLRRAGIKVQPVCVGGSQLIEETVRAAGLSLLRIERILAPDLAQLNHNGALNGHVPVTAINSCILLCAAILYGYRVVAFANERSADEATLETRDGRLVNHQYSKSSAFERSLRRIVAAEISPDIEYLSVLRPWSELAIVRRFAGMPEFHQVYSSCNRNFHLDGSRVSGRWCRDCPKCRFAALSLAVFMSPAEVEQIMGGNMLEDGAQTDGFRALCELGADKPFECVGEAGESRAALKALADRPGWRSAHVVRALLPELESLPIEAEADWYLASDQHSIPGELWSRLRAAW